MLAACGDGRDSDGSESESGSGSGSEADEGESSCSGGFEIDTANCVTDPTSVEITGDTIKFGTSLPQSGTYAAFASILRGEQAYFDYLNAEEGGVDIGGSKYKIELVAEDDAYDAATTLLERAGPRRRRRRVRPLQRDRHEEQPGDPRLRERRMRPESLRGNRFAGWGNPDYPWLIGTPLVPYPLEMQALVQYLEANEPDATIAVLRADDDFGASYSETLQSLIEGTELTIADEQTYDPETGEVATQITSLAATNADVFVLGATLLACPASLHRRGFEQLEARHVHVGDVHDQDADADRRRGRRRRVERGAVEGSQRPVVGERRGDDAVQGEDGQYAAADTDVGNGIVAYGWTVAATLEALLATVEEPNRLGVMQAARELELSDVALQLTDSTWSVERGRLVPRRELRSRAVLAGRRVLQAGR